MQIHVSELFSPGAFQRFRTPMTPCLGLLGLLSLAAPQPSRAPTPGGDLAGEIRSVAEGALMDGEVRGLSIVVEIGGETLVSEGLGSAGCDPESADTRTRFAAGSCLDLLLSISAARLSQGGQLDLDAPVADILEDFPFADESPTVRQLLSHTSGLPLLSDLPPADVRSAAAEEEVEGALLERLGRLPLTATPGTCQSYSSGGVLVLGLVLQKVSGKRVQELIQTDVIEPFGLEDTGFFAPVETTFQRNMGGRLASAPPQPLPFDADALRTTALDLVRLGSGLNAEENAELLDLLRTDVIVHEKLASFAHGLVLGDIDEHEFFSFGGNSESCAIECAVYPDIELTIAICASGGEAPTERLQRRIARLVFGLPDPDILDLALPPAAEQTYAGEFLVGCNSYWFVINGKRLRVTLPEDQSFDLFYQGNHLFVSTLDPDVRFQFEVENGIARQFILEEHGAQVVGKRIQ